MAAIVLMICLISIFIISYTSGNKQANELMVKLGGPLEEIPKWSNYSMLINVALFGLVPLMLAVYQFNWPGILYAPLAFFVSAKWSALFLKNQLRKRLVYKEQSLENAATSSRDQTKTDIEQHSVNELKWLIAHPKSAQHLAISEEDEMHPKIYQAFKFQVEALDRISKQERDG